MPIESLEFNGFTFSCWKWWWFSWKLLNLDSLSKPQTPKIFNEDWLCHHFMNMNNWLIKPAWHIWSSDKKRCSSITIAWNFKTITFSQLNTKKKPGTNWNHQATGSNQPWSVRVKSGKKQCKSSSIWTNEYRRIKKKFNQLRKKAPHQNLYNLFHFLFLSRLVCLRAHSAARLQATPAQCSQQCVCVVTWFYGITKWNRMVLSGSSIPNIVLNLE